jgi:cytochrome c biogenesis protein CcmG/thiol:disulfide interchange protein DsbE
MRAPWRAGTSTAARLCGTGLLLAAIACGKRPADGVRVGDAAPEFALRDLSGHVVRSASLAGAPTVVNFWATWCMPCIGELPVLAGVHRAGAARVVGIAIDSGDAAAVRRFAAAHGIPYALLMGDEETAHRYGIMGIPYTVVLDRDRRVVEVFMGAVTPDDLAAALRRAGA